MSSIKTDIVNACRILVDLKLDSCPFGNISIRDANENAFWHTPRGVTFTHIKEDDLVLVCLGGDVLQGEKQPHPGENIHRQIYRLRNDVKAIVHTHSPNTVAFSLLGQKLEAFSQVGASFYDSQAIYNGFTGPVRSSNEGYAMAKALGSKSLLIAQHHGIFATASSIEEALWDFILADSAALLQCQARHLSIDQPITLSETSLDKSKQEVRHKQAKDMWNSFINRLP